MAAEILDRIVAATRASVETLKRDRPHRLVLRQAAVRTPRADFFRATIGQRNCVNVIAECKHRSPLNGVLREPYDVVALARAYESAGAAAISVLTEESFFGGALDHLHDVRAGVGICVMRKDFIVDDYQVAEARAAGADALLLIVAALGDALPRFVRSAEETGLAALVEVHDREELQRAVDAGAQIVGVNNRNLRTMTVRLETATELASQIPSDVTAVAESGIRTAADIDRLRACGYSAFLVGECLVRSEDPGRALRHLLSGRATEAEGGPGAERSCT